MKDPKKETPRIEQDMEAAQIEMEAAAGEWNEQGLDIGGPSGFEGGASEKLIDAGFFNAFEDDFDEDDIAL